MRLLKVDGNCAYRTIRIVLNVVINRFSVFISYRPYAGWQLFYLFCQSFALVCKTQNETLSGELESMVCKYMYNSNNKKEIVWFEFILIYFQYSFVLRYFVYAKKEQGLR